MYTQIDTKFDRILSFIVFFVFLIAFNQSFIIVAVFTATTNILDLVHYIDFKNLEKIAKLWKPQNWGKKKKKSKIKNPPVVWFQCNSPCPGDDISQNGSLIFLEPW